MADNPQLPAEYVAVTERAMVRAETEVERLRRENASLKAELQRLYGQFRLALSNGEQLLNDRQADG